MFTMRTILTSCFQRYGTYAAHPEGPDNERRHARSKHGCIQKSPPENSARNISGLSKEVETRERFYVLTLRNGVE